MPSIAKLWSASPLFPIPSFWVFFFLLFFCGSQQPDIPYSLVRCPLVAQSPNSFLPPSFLFFFCFFVLRRSAAPRCPLLQPSCCPCFLTSFLVFFFLGFPLSWSCVVDLVSTAARFMHYSCFGFDLDPTTPLHPSNERGETSSPSLFSRLSFDIYYLVLHHVLLSLWQRSLLLLLYFSLFSILFFPSSSPTNIFLDTYYFTALSLHL